MPQITRTLDTVIRELKDIQEDARTNGFTHLPEYPMIILRSPKGWTGPKEVDGKKVEDFWRAHQVPIADMSFPGHLQLLETWMRSYKPEELFDETGRLIPELAELAPKGDRRMGSNPHTNGGLVLKDLKMPDFRDYAVEVPKPGTTFAEATRVMGRFVPDVMKLNLESRNFRLVGPDEIVSNRLDPVLEATDRVWAAVVFPEDEHLAPDGRVMEILSENTCQGSTLETLAAVDLLRQHFPELKVRVVNVVDLMTLQPQSEHPHGLSDKDFDSLFTTDKPIIFAFHGYPWLIHRLTYRRTNHKNLHVRGYKEEGTITTPFDMVVLNDLDRFHLVNDVIDRVPKLGHAAAYTKQFTRCLLNVV